MPKSLRLQALAGGVAAVALAGWVPANAQTASGQGAKGQNAGIETVVVTAQKRSENIQKVPIAISAFTQKELKTQQIAGGPDLIKEVPNLTFSKTNFTAVAQKYPRLRTAGSVVG